MIDYSKLTLVWSDEFDSEEVDRTKWQRQDGTCVRRGGYWNDALAKIEDNKLVIYSKYLENGAEEGDKPGWYTAQLISRGLYEQTYGYFETRCIIPKGYGQWAAFWLNSEAMSHDGLGSEFGCEIDVFESAYYGSDTPEKVSSAVHWGGYRKSLRSISPTATGVMPTDPYNAFNTYALKWDESGYTFYINGEVYAYLNAETLKPSQTPEYLLLSVEHSGLDGVPAQDRDPNWAPGNMDDNGRDFVSKFIVDYVRCYKFKD